MGVSSSMRGKLKSKTIKNNLEYCYCCHDVDYLIWKNSKESDAKRLPRKIKKYAKEIKKIHYGFLDERKKVINA